ncbi:MAG: SusD/RagB family nutrient-binding outer membrane lipoprotein [Bacteroidota bacterium]
MKAKFIMTFSKLTVLGLIAVVFVSSFSGCESFTEGYKENPLAPTTAPADKTFIGAETAFMVFMEGFPSQLASIWAQQIYGAERQFGGYQGYTVTAQDFQADWFLAYSGALTNLRITQNKATADGGKGNLVGAAKILEGITMGTVASLWGDVPYSQADQFNVTSQPKYDNQIEVYNAVLKVLNDGITDFSGAMRKLDQDALSYNGDPARWVKAARTARARYLMQLARSQNYSSAALNLVIQEAQQGILATNGSEDLKILHATGTYQGDMNSWYSFQVFDRSGYISADQTFVYPMMKELSLDGKTDESGRMTYYFTADGKNLNTTSGAYTASSPYPVIRASETYLLMAEAYARLGDNANAIANLNKAREYNNNVYGNKSKNFDALDFLLSGKLLQTILNEEYLSLMHQIEVFNFLRRIDFKISYTNSQNAVVSLKPSPGNTQFPQRFLYSSDEFTSNPNMPRQSSADLFAPTRVNGGNK